MIVPRALAKAHDDEAKPLFWAWILVSSLLAGNYLIRPVRAEIGIAGGTAYLPTLFSGTRSNQSERDCQFCGIGQPTTGHFSQILQTSESAKPISEDR